ncbi:MAG: glycosyltransferase [Pseudomonadota bacterium]
MEGATVIVPIFNEEAVLARTFAELHRYLTDSGRPYEMILGDDGSTDASRTIAERFARSDPKRIRVLGNAANAGRGSILSAAFGEARMPIAAYIDADLEIGLESLGRLLAVLDRKEVVACTGSKLLTARGGRQTHRRMATRVLNALIRSILHSKVTDHQCGLKGFRTEFLRPLLVEVREKRWAWDTEVLLLVQKRGVVVEEIPVEVTPKRKSTVAFLPTTFLFLRKIFEFRKRGLTL